MFFFSLLCVYRAKQRAEWRAARLKSLEQDALQAQMILKSMTGAAEDMTDANKIARSVSTCSIYLLRFFMLWASFSI